MNSETYLSLLVIGAIATSAYSIIATKFLHTMSMQINYVGVFITGTALIIGVLAGTFYSHGFDIPWWLFSVLYIVVCVVFFCIGKLIVWLKNKLQNK